MSLAEVQVDENRLDRDDHYRLTHYQEFLGWTEADHEAVRATTAKVVPYAQQLIDAVYDHLFRFSLEQAAAPQPGRDAGRVAGGVNRLSGPRPIEPWLGDVLPDVCLSHPPPLTPPLPSRSLQDPLR